MNYRHPLATSAAALVLSVAAQPSLALTWKYFDPTGYTADGVPKTLVTESLPANLLTNLYARLPEGLDINQNKDEKKFLTDNLGANIHLLADSEITVIALGGKTDYANAVGFFTYPTDNAPKTTTGLNTQILFPNVPAMIPGQAVKLGTFKAGTSVGFVSVANGWQQGQVNPNQAASEIFYTIRALNPETPSNDGNSHLNAHTVLLTSSEDKLLVLGFEDAYRHPSNKDKTKPLRSDDDFNDVLLAIRVSSVGKNDDNKDDENKDDDSNADLTGITTLDPVPKDSDGDGIIDDLDAFPLDPARAARRFYPNAAGYGFLAFEDLWPKKGDFDMNDLLVAYRTVETLNARNEIVDLKLSYELRARGAGSDNGLGIHFPGLSVGTIDPAATTLTINHQAPVALPVESGQSEAVFILSNNVTPLTSTGQAFPCSMMNTVMKCARTAPVPLVVDIHFKTPLTRAQLGDAPYNPFIYRTGKRGLEIHLVDHPPTAKADPKLFGTLDDRSVPSQGRYYRTAANEPWALDVPETWRHPTEWINISGAYPDFVTWATSGGTTAQNWYIGKVAEALVFKP
jgi:LruC domain-containing protein